MSEKKGQEKAMGLKEEWIDLVWRQMNQKCYG